MYVIQHVYSSNIYGSKTSPSASLPLPLFILTCDSYIDSRLCSVVRTNVSNQLSANATRDYHTSTLYGILYYECCCRKYKTALINSFNNTEIMKNQT